jgi:hypothetical protein
LYLGAVFCQTIFSALSFAKLPDVANQKWDKFDPSTDFINSSVKFLLVHGEENFRPLGNYK